MQEHGKGKARGGGKGEDKAGSEDKGGKGKVLPGAGQTLGRQGA